MKNLLLSAFFSSFFLLLTLNQAEANMFNRFKKGFYFEKYRTAQEAQTALLEMHPIGSDVEGLLKTLEATGAKCGSITNPDYKDKPEYKNLIYCSCYTSKLIIFSTEWRVLIRFDTKNPAIIANLETYKFFHSL
ncbi:MAG: hypothetical protein SFV53_06540 [Rickettsiales bacterium]|nr:hypothetical protein [Rickettsiales bacterium]